MRPLGQGSHLRVCARASAQKKSHQTKFHVWTNSLRYRGRVCPSQANSHPDSAPSGEGGGKGVALNWGQDFYQKNRHKLKLGQLGQMSGCPSVPFESLSSI